MSKKKFAIIIQARTDSTRFPKKVLSKIEGRSLLWHVIHRAKKINDAKIIVATTRRKVDNEIVRIAKNSNVSFFRGKKYDVLDRYLNAAKKFNIDIIMRITSDCPLIDPNESKKVLKKFLDGKYDYVATDEISYPKGLDTECFSFKTLMKASKLAKSKDYREHVTKFLYNNPKKFRVGFVYNKKRIPVTKNWVVDYKKDLDFVKEIYAFLYSEKKIFGMNDIIKILEKKRKIFNKMISVSK